MPALGSVSHGRRWKQRGARGLLLSAVIWPNCIIASQSLPFPLPPNLAQKALVKIVSFTCFFFFFCKPQLFLGFCLPTPFIQKQCQFAFVGSCSPEWHNCRNDSIRERESLMCRKVCSGLICVKEKHVRAGFCFFVFLNQLYISRDCLELEKWFCSCRRPKFASQRSKQTSGP